MDPYDSPLRSPLVVSITHSPMPQQRVALCSRGAGTLVGAVSDLGYDCDRVPVRANIIPPGRGGELGFRGLGFRVPVFGV